MNLLTTADAIAARFTSVSVTVNGATETVTGTSRLPDAVGKLALLVYPPTGEAGLAVSKRRTDTLEFPVRLLRDPVSTPARAAALYAWYDALRDLVEADMDLGLSYVAWAQVISVRVEIDGESYSQSNGTYGRFDVVELIVRVRFDEVVTTVAI